MEIKICYYYIIYGKSFPSFPVHRKKFFFSFQLCSTANSKFSFHVSLCEINCFKIETMCLVSKCIYFNRDSLCSIYFDGIIRQPLKKKVKLVFSVTRRSVIKRSTDSTRSTTSGQTDTTSGQADTMSGQTSITSQQTSATSGKTSTTSV